MRVQMLPAGVHDLTPVHELAYGLPAGARLLGDKAYNSAADEASILAETGVRLDPVRRANMRPHAERGREVVRARLSYASIG